MEEQKWKRKEYETWDEAFRGLSPIIRQQSVRVAAYTQALFVTACKLNFGADTQDGKERIRGQYADLAYKCGLYHQIGKALVPPEYQILQKDFTEEETAVYRKYTSDGRILAAKIQEKNARAKEKHKGEWIERPTNNIPWLMIREACEQHMERWDGSGYPLKRFGSDISPIAQLVGIAKELDIIASETRSESPFDTAYDALMSGAGAAWSTELIGVLTAAKDACCSVYRKYVAYTRTLPKTIPLVEKRADRVMGLQYRPMASDEHGSILMYEATPWFGGVADQPDVTENAAELRELFRRTNLTEDLSWYFLYEVADAVLRIQNCKLGLEGILLNMLPDFYSLPTQLQHFAQLFEDQPIPKDRLLLTLPEEVYLNAGKTSMELIERYLRNGICLVLDDYHPENIPSEQLLAIGLTHVRLHIGEELSAKTAADIKKLRSQGFAVFATGADTPDLLSRQIACGVSAASGTMTGIPVDENNMIMDSLSREEDI